MVSSRAPTKTTRASPEKSKTSLKSLDLDDPCLKPNVLESVGSGRREVYYGFSGCSVIVPMGQIYLLGGLRHVLLDQAM